MDKRLLTVLVAVALAAGVGIGAAIWAGGDHGDDMAGASTGHGGGIMMTTSMDEQAFLEEMVPHHESAVEMATMALEESTRPGIRRLARDIIDAQETEIARMRQWHRQWFGSELGAGSIPRMDMGDLEGASGEDFDRVFLRAMIAHHAGAIMMADAVAVDDPRAEVATLAAEIVSAQSREIGEMQRWREQWFPPLG